MEITDAYYNGTYSLTLSPPPSNNTYNCTTLSVSDIPNAFLRLGPQTKNNISRADYGDKNSYYMHFGRTIFEQDCPRTPNKAFVNFESSNDNVESAQIWTLKQQKKEGNDAFELEGSLTSQFGSWNNYFNYVVNTTGTDKGYNRTCPTVFQIRSLLAKTAAKFNATVTAGEADFSFSFTDTETQWTVSGSFAGKHWDQGPKLLFDNDGIATEGQTEHVKPRAPKDKRPWTDKYLKYILIAVGVVVLIGVLIFIWKCAAALFACLKCCFPCCRRKSRANRPDKYDVSSYQTTSPSTHQPHGTPQMVYTNKVPATETVTAVMPHDPRGSDCNYAVSPTVMQSYYIRGGEYLIEVANAQMELHRAQKDLLQAFQRGQEDKVGSARAMVGHHTAVIEHYMALRATGR
jgi:hypothetical protein